MRQAPVPHEMQLSSFILIFLEMVVLRVEILVVTKILDVIFLNLPIRDKY